MYPDHDNESLTLRMLWQALRCIFVCCTPPGRECIPGAHLQRVASRVQAAAAAVQALPQTGGRGRERAARALRRRRSGEGPSARQLLHDWVVVAVQALPPQSCRQRAASSTYSCRDPNHTEIN